MAAARDNLQHCATAARRCNLFGNQAASFSLTRRKRGEASEDVCLAHTAAGRPGRLPLCPLNRNRELRVMAPNLQNQFAANRSPGFPAASTRPLTRYQIREVRRRQKILTAFHSLIDSGMSRVTAAKQLRQSLTTLWCWERRIIPLTHRCGRKSLFDQWAVSPAIVRRVQRFQIAGMSNANAWRAVLTEKRCPPHLADFLRKVQNIPLSFLRASRIVREPAQLIRGRGFVCIFTSDAPAHSGRSAGAQTRLQCAAMRCSGQNL